MNVSHSKRPRKITTLRCLVTEGPPQAAVHHFQSEVPPTPATNRDISRYATSIPQEQTYQQPQLLPMEETFSIGHQYFLPDNVSYQISQPSYWLPDWKDKADTDIGPLPDHRLNGLN